MEPTALELYYNGNYVGKSKFKLFYYFTYRGKLYMVVSGSGGVTEAEGTTLFE